MELPVVDFTTDPEEIDILDPRVQFVNLSTDANEFIWTFGDGSGSSEVDRITRVLCRRSV